MECWASILTLTYSTNKRQQSYQFCTPATLSPKETPWYSFLLEAQGIPGLLNADKRSLENLQGSTGNQTQNLLSCGTVPQPTALPASEETGKP
jgi:hypothetical protein